MPEFCREELTSSCIFLEDLSTPDSYYKQCRKHHEKAKGKKGLLKWSMWWKPGQNTYICDVGWAAPGTVLYSWLPHAMIVVTTQACSCVKHTNISIFTIVWGLSRLMLMTTQSTITTTVFIPLYSAVILQNIIFLVKCYFIAGDSVSQRAKQGSSSWP